MAEFSKEYIKKEGWETEYDFCILDEFNKLKEGETINLICEGFGSSRVHRINNQCCLWLPRTEEYTLLEELV